ncbi:hypothetical protein GGR44_000518 [Sphingobium fontiphilum]|uniref:Uncharacterized protein n=1 Tax=Sphingobium fontiphilum TaxID=944425 RepID=A0A7W6DDV7_9SPHN|nr:hypothetical protein [Sphingobium fontiphilum]MBB3980887.1 hypothetical protein [Sphingobium fontiphilum]
MIRTLIFGAIAGYVGKKLYDEGKLDAFRDDLVKRFNELKQPAPADAAPAAPPAATPVH